MGQVFDHDDLRLIVLKLIADRPSYGYGLLKAIEIGVGGAYAPSPGLIYPTLTLLEELDYVIATQADGKALYTITDEGQAFLDSNSQLVNGLFDRIARVAAQSAAFSPQIQQARENLKSALRLKLAAGALAPEQVEALARVLGEAAVAIDGI